MSGWLWVNALAIAMATNALVIALVARAEPWICFGSLSVACLNCALGMHAIERRWFS